MLHASRRRLTDAQLGKLRALVRTKGLGTAARLLGLGSSTVDILLSAAELRPVTVERVAHVLATLDVQEAP